MDVPASVTRTRDAFRDHGLKTLTDDANGARVRALAATRVGGIMLVSGIEGLDLGAWIIDGLDISSRLVVHHNDDVDAASVAACFNNDLRVTSHVQPLNEFLDDVSHHRFALLVLADAGLSVETFERAAAMVEDGGMLILTGALTEASRNLAFPDGFCHMHESAGQRIVVKRHPGNRPQRRGGRRRNR